MPIQIASKLQKFRTPRAVVCCLAAVAGLCLANCARDSAKRAPAASTPVCVGEVAFVNAKAGFALVESASAISLPPVGSELTARQAGGEESARLKVTPERKRPFITADIVSGQPTVGERVYQ